MPGNKAKQDWESKQKAYGEEVDVGGSQEGWAGLLGKSGCPEETSQVLWHGNKRWVIRVIFGTWAKLPAA